jgi:hypothetical protein
VSETRKKPSAYFYLLALGILVFGISGSLVQGCGAAVESVASMERFAVPGEHEMELSPGEQTIFYERHSRLDGEVFTGPETPGNLVCQVASAGGGELEVRKPTIDESYDLGDYHGRAAWAFEVPRPGRYRLSCELPDPDTRIVVAIGQGFSVGDLLIAILGVTFSVMISVIISLVTFLRRRRS